MIGPNQWATERSVMDLGRAVAEYGRSLLVYLDDAEFRLQERREHEELSRAVGLAPEAL